MKDLKLYFDGPWQRENACVSVVSAVDEDPAMADFNAFRNGL